jgi:hypothetical protein
LKKKYKKELPKIYKKKPNQSFLLKLINYFLFFELKFKLTFFLFIYLFYLNLINYFNITKIILV